MGVLLCLYYNTEYMTVIVAFPKIFRRIFWRRSTEDGRGSWRVLVEKGDGHYVQNNRLVVGRNIYQKPMPKQDKKNATTCIFEPSLRADNSRETRGNFL